MTIGAINVKTKYTAMAESDVIYHRSYFEFRPPEDDVFYHTGNFYINWWKRPTFWLKNNRENSCITTTDCLRDVLNRLDFSKHLRRELPKLVKQEDFWHEVPVVTLKTRNGMHWKSPCSRVKNKDILPYWGTGKDVWKRLLS
jgi:hypothetical protein